MEIEEVTRREERKSKVSSQIHLQMKNATSQSQRIVDVDYTSQTHLKKRVTWLIDREGQYMKMRWKHRNYIVMSGRRPREEKNGNCRLTILLDTVSQQIPHITIIPPEGDTS